MTAALVIEASPCGERALSRLASARLLAWVRGRAPGLRVIHRDLAARPPSFVDVGFATAMLVAPEARTPAQIAALAESERLIAEIETTQLLVIGTPMHNFTGPAVLKAWIDQVLRVERTFRRTASGKVGTLRPRPCYLVVASGGYISGPAARQPDFLVPYLRAVLTTLGLGEPQILRLEALSAAADAPARVTAEIEAWLGALERQGGSSLAL